MFVAILTFKTETVVISDSATYVKLPFVCSTPIITECFFFALRGLRNNMTEKQMDNSFRS